MSRQPERHAETTLLLDRWHAGDREALDRLVSTHLEWIRARLHERQGALLRERAETGDYVQQTLLEFLRYGPPFRLTDGDRFRGLLLTIAENVLRGGHEWWTRKRRALARERPLPTDSVLDLEGGMRSPDPSERVQQAESEHWVRLGLELLADVDRHAIVLHDYDGLTFAEVGARTDCSESAARKRYQRAVVRLAQIVGSLRRGGLDAALSISESDP